VSSDGQAEGWSFDAVVQQHGAALSRFAWGYVDNEGDHADLLQEMLVALWQALPRFRGESSVWTFTFRVAHNRAVSFAARARRRRTVPSPEHLHDTRPGPDAVVEARSQRQRLMAAIRRLPDAQRQAVMLYLAGASAEEIAAVQSISPNNAAVRLTRARQALRVYLEGE
jgi:RNA polymerase sigma-70 factor (ECF subfamily)